MKAVRIGLLLLFCAAAGPALAQEEVKSWIFLTDKLDAAGKNTSVEPGYISLRAQRRRRLRGTKSSAWQDAPLSPYYLQALEQEGLTLINRSRWLNAVTAYLTPSQRQAISNLSFVRDVRPVAHLSASTGWHVPAPPVVAAPASSMIDCGHSCWQLELVNAIAPLERGINGQGVVIGFVDTRFDLSGDPFDHDALKHIRDGGKIQWRDFATRDTTIAGALEGSRHGMSVASVAVGHDPGNLIGPCYGADKVYAAATEWTGYERNIEEDNFVAGVEWMEAEGVDVINSSLGYYVFEDGQRSYTTADLDGDTGITTIAFDLAADKGVVPVASAGNLGLEAWQRIVTPADGDSVIAAGGVRLDSTYWPISSTGPSADGRIKPDVAALGLQVYVAVAAADDLPPYTYSNGTSFSSPMVAGVVCQILQVDPTLNPAMVADVLRNTASQASSPDNYLGWGIINADAAVKAVEDTGTQRTVPPDAPTSLRIRPPYPNPFSERVHLTVDIPKEISYAHLAIYNMLGQQVLVPFTERLRPGSHEIAIAGQGLPAGLYTLVLTADEEVRTQTLVLVR